MTVVQVKSSVCSGPMDLFNQSLQYSRGVPSTRGEAVLHAPYAAMHLKGVACCNGGC